MNEVTKIHLGRQAFSISIAAQKELRIYLDAIEKQIEDKDVLEEIEIRMAELLAEHGVTGTKVILPKDVDYLKKRLGHPKDFKEDVDEIDTNAPIEGKRLFRDTDNAMIAGVASGLSEYFGIDVILVRILFVISVFAWGWGILVYIVLWLLVPEAKTSSDRLIMAGKPVTVDSLKQVAKRADVKGAAYRANKSLAGPINSIFDLILKLIGIGFVVAGLAALFGLIAAETYILVHNGNFISDNLFPVGFREHLLLHICLAVAALISIFLILFGMAIFRRKWPIRTWITGVLIGLVLIGIATSAALAADVAPTVRDRYNANRHVIERTTKPFSYVNTIGKTVDINFSTASSYYVTIDYYGNPNLGKIKTNVANGTLTIDSSQFDPNRHCQAICIPDTYDITVNIYSPNPPVNLTPSVIKPLPPGLPLRVNPNRQQIYQLN